MPMAIAQAGSKDIPEWSGKPLPEGRGCTLSSTLSSSKNTRADNKIHIDSIPESRVYAARTRIIVCSISHPCIRCGPLFTWVCLAYLTPSNHSNLSPSSPFHQFQADSHQMKSSSTAVVDKMRITRFLTFLLKPIDSKLMAIGVKAGFDPNPESASAWLLAFSILRACVEKAEEENSGSGHCRDRAWSVATWAQNIG